MKNTKTTKRALGTAVVALLICFTMLIGTTYAWFTDVVTSSNNIIKTGTLDAVVTWSDKYTTAEEDWYDVEDPDTNALFEYELWEPGYTAVRYLKVANVGSLAFKYKLVIVVNGETDEGAANAVKLADVIDVYYASEKVDVPNRDLDNNANLTKVGTLSDVIAGTSVVEGVLLAGQTDSANYGTIVLKMQESAGNEYQNLSVGTSFDLMLFATQYTYEEDSFDHLYDEQAAFPAFGSDSANANNPADYEPEGLRMRLDVMNQSNGGHAKLATFHVWPESLVDRDEDIQITVKQTDTLSGNITLDDGQSTQNYEISVTNLKAGNTKPVNVTLRIGANKNFVALYHKDTLINASYDAIEGNLVFETTDFSPFTVVLADEPAQINPDLPNATIENITVQQPAEGYEYGYVGADFNGLTLVDAEKLDAVYKITAHETPEEAELNKYADWKCDFFVKVNKDIAVNSIILAGQYDAFLSNWVAFSNPIEIEGETYIPLLLLVSGGWTYEDIVKGVGTFNCGVKDADGSLAANDVTFTVQLRLVNPEIDDLQNPAEGEYIVIDEVSYNFATGTSSK